MTLNNALSGICSADKLVIEVEREKRMSRERICVYTCITGNYDDLQPVYQEEGIDYLCFTNNKDLESDDWKIIYIEDTDCLGNMMLSRQIKMIGHPFIEENYDISIWMDGAVQVRAEMGSFLEQCCGMDKHHMACFRHSVRDCAYEEAAACIIGRKEQKENIIPLLDFLREEKFPEHYGLAECTVLIRRHNEEDVKKAMRLWFELLIKYAKRDQLSFPYSIKKTGLQVQWIDMNVFDNPWFCRIAHRCLEELESCRIMFGEYKDVYTDVYKDCKLETAGKKCKMRFEIPIDCNEMVINLGTYFGKLMYDFVIDVPGAEVIYCSGIPVLHFQVFDNEDMVIKVTGEFIAEQEVCCSFALSNTGEQADQEFMDVFVERYYYDKRSLRNTVYFLNQQNDKISQKYDKLSDKYKRLKKKLIEFMELKKTPLLGKVRPLCERQDIKAKIIRSIILRNF